MIPPALTHPNGARAADLLAALPRSARGTPAAYLDAARQTLRALMGRPDLLDGLTLERRPRGYARTLLFGGGGLSVWAIVWSPDARTSVHDHHCSCCFGVWKGVIREVWFRPTTSNCDASDDTYATQPRLIYPEAYSKRSIEGWAIVAFDVAPWGELGNLRVLASQPSEDFGQQALQVLRSARKAPSQAGRVGCVDKVVFRMGPTDEEASAL